MIAFNYPYWYLLFCLLTATGYSYFLYRKEKSFGEQAKTLIYSLASLRFLSVFILSFLLLEPVVKTTEQIIEKPILVIAQDASQSIVLTKDSSYYQTTYLENLKKLETELSQQYEVKTISFGSEIKDGLPQTFNQKQTDISSVFQTIKNTYYGRNLGGIILATDGISNKGLSPEYASKQLKNTVFYTIAMGDTLIPKDALIHSVFHNKTAFKGNDFPVEVVVKATYLKGKNANVSIYRNDKKIQEKKIAFQHEKAVENISFVLPADKGGNLKYTIKITEFPGEATTINNTKDFYITVIENKQNILLLADAPHPDVAVWKETLSKNKNYKVESVVLNDLKTEIKKYSLVMLFGIPNHSAKGDRIIEKLQQAKVPFFIEINQHTDFNKINNLKLRFQVKASNDFIPATAQFNTLFSKFTLSESLKNLLSELPPVFVPFARDYKTAQEKNVLFFQKINGVNTKYPLLLFNEKDGLKSGILLGEGIWRWKLFDYVKNNNHRQIEELTQKIAQYLVARKDKSQFRVFNTKKILENEPLIIEAELYNDAYEAINTPDVSVTISNEKGEDYPPKIMNRVGNSYKLNAGMFPVGEYSYTAKVIYDGKKLIKKGTFSVMELKVEYLDLSAKHNWLNRIAENSNGKLFYPNELETLQKEIQNQKNIIPIIYEKNTVEDIIRWKWIFFLVLALLSIEWFLRKRNGSY